MSWLNFYNSVRQDNEVQNQKMAKVVGDMQNIMYQKRVFDLQKEKEAKQVQSYGNKLGVNINDTTGNPDLDLKLTEHLANENKLRETIIANYGDVYDPKTHDKMTTTELSVVLPKLKKAGDIVKTIKTEASVNPLFAKELAKYKDWEKQPPEYQEAILTHAKERAKQVQENIDYNTKLSIGDAHEKVSQPKDKETTVRYYKDKQGDIRKLVLQKDANGVWRDPQTGEQADINDIQWLNPKDESLVDALKYGTVKKGILGKVKGKDPNSMQTPPISGKIDYNKYKRKS